MCSDICNYIYKLFDYCDSYLKDTWNYKTINKTKTLNKKLKQD